MTTKYKTDIYGKAMTKGSMKDKGFTVKQLCPFLCQFITPLPDIHNYPFSTLQTRVNHETTDDR